MTMAMIEDARFVTIDRRKPFEVLTRHDPAFGALGLLMFALMAPTLFAAFADERLFQGVNVWVKPLKFEFSLAVYLLTLAFFARWLPAGIRARRWYRIYVAAVIAAIIGEIVWIGGAAALATASHFNETPVGVAIYGLMGAGAVLLTSVTAVYAWQIARNDALRIPAAFKESLVLGLALVLPLTLLTAGTMSGLGSHWVGGVPADAGGLPLMGWSREVGDLRVAHFFATHAMHVVPIFGVASVWAFGADDRRPVRLVAALFVLLVLFTFVQALLGRPFLP